MIKKKGPDRVMSQQRCEIQIGKPKQFGADGDLSRLTGQPYSTVREPRAERWWSYFMGTGALSADHMWGMKQ